jgi:hypothetical protein
LSQDKRHPKTVYDAKYPYNRIEITESGHEIHYDDTPGKERIRRSHKSGTYEEISHDGKVVRMAVGNLIEYAKQGKTTTVDKNHDEKIGGSSRVSVSGGSHSEIKGNSSTAVDGDHKTMVGKDMVSAVKGDSVSGVGGKTTLRLAGEVTMKGDGEVKTKVDGTATHEYASDVTTSSTTQIVHKVGGSSITMTSSSITLTVGGTSIMITDGYINIDAATVDVSRGQQQTPSSRRFR